MNNKSLTDITLAVLANAIKQEKEIDIMKMLKEEVKRSVFTVDRFAFNL